MMEFRKVSFEIGEPILDQCVETGNMQNVVFTLFSFVNG